MKNWLSRQHRHFKILSLALAIFTSLALHLAPSYLWNLFQPLDQNKQSTHTFHEIQLHLTEKTTDRPNRPRAVKKKTTLATRKLFQLNRTLLAYDSKDSRHNSPTKNSREGSHIGHDLTPGGYGDGDSLQGVLLRSKPVEELAYLLKTRIEYPDIFVEQDIQGTVSLLLKISPTLKLLSWEKPSGTNELLTAYVLVMVVKALEDYQVDRPRPSPTSEALTVHLNFNFKTQLLYPNQFDKLVEIADPEIHFQYIRFRQPTLVRWMLEHLPIVPVPGGFQINVIAVINLIENWEKVDPDVRRKQLLHSVHQKVLYEREKLDAKKMSSTVSDLPVTQTPE